MSNTTNVTNSTFYTKEMTTIKVNLLRLQQMQKKEKSKSKVVPCH